MARACRCFCVALLIALACAGGCAAARGQSASAGMDAIAGLGRGTIALDGEWKFHPGDDPAWAAPNFDDSAWQQIQVGRSWESQGHPGYTGFAWYRRRITLPTNASGLRLALYLPQVDSAGEVYWNGRLAGSYGKVPPNPVWYGFLSPAHKTIDLGPAPNNTIELAIRVWKAPYVFLSYPEEGGILAAPILGGRQDIANLVAADYYQFQRETRLEIFVAYVSGIVAAMALLFWLRRRQSMLLWLAIALINPALMSVLFRNFDPINFRLSYALIGIVVESRDIAVWFLLIALLGLGGRKRLVRWTTAIAVFSISMQIIEGCLQLLNWNGPLAQPLLIADIVTTVPSVLLETWGLVLVFSAFRERLNAARWTLAIAALLSTLLQCAGDITGLGVRWTHWTADYIFGLGIIKVKAYPITAEAIVDTFFLAAILYAVWRYSVEHSERENALEQELAQAQEVQQVLIPAQLPAVPGYTVTSAYHPAREVGGDFFQIVPLASGGTLVVIGDVSGKGLHAAMAVSLIVGSIRSTVETTGEPAAILSALNRLLHGRLPNGFATCLTLRLESDGSCALACAGHLPPFLDGKEVALPPALPLGLVPQAEYETTSLRIPAGRRLTLYTDGLPEAQSGAGELFGFVRMENLLREGRDAEGMAHAAQQFGQEDDITVLTLARSGTA